MIINTEELALAAASAHVAIFEDRDPTVEWQQTEIALLVILLVLKGHTVSSAMTELKRCLAEAKTIEGIGELLN